MTILQLKEVGSVEFERACRIAGEVIPVSNRRLRSVAAARIGCFSVMVIDFADSPDNFQLRALFYYPSDDEQPELVQLNFSFRPFCTSTRPLNWSASYEELRAVYAGTPVLVLSARNFCEFTRLFDEFDPGLKNLLSVPEDPSYWRCAA